MIIDRNIQRNGFPLGYFVIASAATDRIFDVRGDAVEDGTEVVLYPRKEKSLVESLRDPRANNQVFFIDPSGALCSRSSGHAIDVEGDRLVIRHRRPVSEPFPNAYSHPLPVFTYDRETQEISVKFSANPEYPSPNLGSTPSNAWKAKSYILSSIPMPRTESVINNASAFISSTIATPFSFLTGLGVSARATPKDIFDGQIDLNDDAILEQDRGEEGDADDSADSHRKLRVLTISAEDEGVGLRRKWIVESLRTSAARTF